MGWNSKLGIAAICLSALITGIFSPALAAEDQGGLCVVYARDVEKEGYVDAAGRWVVQPQYEYAYSFADGQARVQRNGKYGFIDKTGREIIAPQYEYAAPFADGLARVQRNGKYGYMDKTGREIIAPQYEDANSFADGLALVKRNGKWGYIDKTGRENIAPQYEAAVSFADGLAPVQRNGKWGYMDKTGRENIAPQYEYAAPFADGLAQVKRNGKYGFIDKTGREVLPIRYESEKHCGNGLFVVSDVSGGPNYLLDANLNRITEFDRQEEARAPDYYKFQRALGGSDPQKMYLAAGGYARNGDDDKAKKIYEAIIDRFPDSDFAVKANDQLLAGKRQEKARESEPNRRQEPSSAYQPGERVCVNVWQGTGYCGVIDRTSGDRLRVEITDVSCGGLIGRCNESSCSGGRAVSRIRSNDAANVGDFVWTQQSCVTSR